MNFLRSGVSPLINQSHCRFLSLLPFSARNAINEIASLPPMGVNGYNLFYAEKFGQHKDKLPNNSVTELAKKAASEWNGMDAVKKKEYQDRATKISEQRKKERQDAFNKLSFGAKIAVGAVYCHPRYASGLLERKDIPREIKVFLKGMPAAPFVNGLRAFMSTKLTGKPEDLSAAHKQWKAMSEGEKKKYNDVAVASQMKFKEALKKYINGFSEKDAAAPLQNKKKDSSSK